MKLTLGEKITYLIILIAVSMVVSVTFWETYLRNDAIKFFDGGTVVYEQATSTEATEFDIFVASEEAQSKLRVLFEQHQIEIKQDELDKLQEELEARKEGVRAQELGL
jgi:hypothetical protein